MSNYFTAHPSNHTPLPLHEDGSTINYKAAKNDFTDHQRNTPIFTPELHT